ncbi:hypothetical protein, partial [Pseudomonas aeruginosa]
DFGEWRDAARAALAADIPPETIDWRLRDDGAGLLDFAGEPLPTVDAGNGQVSVPASFVALAQAVIAAASIIDFSSVIIDGGFPDWVRTRIVAATRLALKHHDLQGVTVPDIIEGAVGSQARAIGGASLPLFSRYLIDQNVLFKDTTG